MAIATRALELTGLYFDEQKLPPRHLFSFEKVLSVFLNGEMEPEYGSDTTTYSYTEFVKVGPYPVKDLYVLFVKKSGECKANAIRITCYDDGIRLSELTQLTLRPIAGRPTWHQTTRYVRAVDLPWNIIVLNDEMMPNSTRPMVSLYNEEPLDLEVGGYWEESDAQTKEEDNEDESYNLFLDLDNAGYHQIRRPNRLHQFSQPLSLWDDEKPRARRDRGGRGDVIIAKHRRSARKYKVCQGEMYAFLMEWHLRGWLIPEVEYIHQEDEPQGMTHEDIEDYLDEIYFDYDEYVDDLLFPEELAS